MVENTRDVWRHVSTLCGGIVALLISVLLFIVIPELMPGTNYQTLAVIRHMWLNFLLLTWQGVVLGAVGGYIMSWLSPHLRAWFARFCAAGIVGALIGGFLPGFPDAIWAWWLGIPGAFAALISTAVVRRVLARKRACD